MRSKPFWIRPYLLRLTFNLADSAHVSLNKDGQQVLVPSSTTRCCKRGSPCISWFCCSPDNIVIFREGYQDRKRKKIRRKTLPNNVLCRQSSIATQLSLEARVGGCVACKRVIVTVLSWENAAPWGSCWWTSPTDAAAYLESQTVKVNSLKLIFYTILFLWDCYSFTCSILL